MEAKAGLQQGWSWTFTAVRPKETVGGWWWVRNEKYLLKQACRGELTGSMFYFKEGLKCEIFKTLWCYKQQTKKGPEGNKCHSQTHFLKIWINEATSKGSRKVDAAAGNAQWQPGEAQKVPKLSLHEHAILTTICMVRKTDPSGPCLNQGTTAKIKENTFYRVSNKIPDEI